MNQPYRDHPIDSAELVAELVRYVARAVERLGGSTVAIKPSHRVKFEWPPHPISYSFHVVSSDWRGHTTFESHGETFDVNVAKTPFGVFGRCKETWHEARGGTEGEMLAELKATAEPLLRRQLMMSEVLEIEGRFKGAMRDLPPIGLLKLLYCPDRDIANEAHLLIEADHDRRQFLPALILILEDRTHPHRRSAQWCVLDLFEDLPSFCETEDDEANAISAMKGILADAEDDYARTVYKAGVVLGGHIPHRHGGQALIDSLEVPSKIGRRSAIHGLFHVVEWVPTMKSTVLEALRVHSAKETDPQLRDFATNMVRDIQIGGVDHTPEPVFPEEQD